MEYLSKGGLERYHNSIKSKLHSTNDIVTLIKENGVKYSEFYGIFFLYSGDYDYNTEIDDDTSFSEYLFQLIGYIYSLSLSPQFKENIEGSNNNSNAIKELFSKLLNELTENSSCICSFYSSTVDFYPDDNSAIVMIGNIGVSYENENNNPTLSTFRLDSYYAGTNISIVDGTINNTLDVSGKEETSNKVTSLSSSSTDKQYPSAKCVYDLVGNIESLLQEV